ncbi:MAG: HypC/HybG/HupF family hydrogenase formation chaperone [Bacteroidota bacterium]
MCLAIPGKVVEFRKEERPAMGVVSFGGIRKQVCLEWVPEVQLGDYVIVHVGFAISVLDEVEARKTLDLFKEIDNTNNTNDSNGHE